jgi:hypothetical protein
LGYGQPFYLTTGYFLKLGLPAFTGLGDEQQNQTVPRFAKFIVGYLFHAP